MAERIIGSAWVKIRALTDSLDKEIRDAFKDLDSGKAGKELGRDLAKGINDGIEEGMKDTRKTLNDALEGATEHQTVKIDVEPEIDKDKFNKAVDEATAGLSKDKNVKIEVHPDIDHQAWRNRILDGLVDLNELRDAKIKINPEFDDTGIFAMQRRLADILNESDWEINLGLNNAQLHHIEQQINDMKDEVENDEIELSLSLGAFAKKWVQGQLAVLTRNRAVKIFTELDPKSFTAVMTALAALSGLRMLDNTFTRLKDLLKDLDKNVPKLAAVSSIVGLIANLALTATSNILAMLSSIAEIAGILIAAPGILTGLGIGVGTFIAALKDWSTYMEDVNRQFSSLQDMISGNFWAIAEEPIRNMVNSLLPGLRDGFDLTSRSLGYFTEALANAFVEHMPAEALRVMFENLALSIDISAGYADAFARVIENLGTMGSEYLPRLAKWFGEISEKFASWLERNRESGKLTEWMELGIQRTKEFGAIVRDATAIIYNLGVIAERAGGSSLTRLADTLAKVRDVVSGEPFQTELEKVFMAAHDAMTLAARQGGQAFSDMIQGLVPTLQNTLPIIGQALGHILEGVSNAINTSGFKEGLENMFRGIRDGFAEAAEYWVPLGEGIGALGDIIGTATENFLPLLGQALAAVSDIIVELAPTIQYLVEVLSSQLSVALEIVTPLLQALASIIGAIPAPIVVALADAFLVLGVALKFQHLVTTNPALQLLQGNIGKLPGVMQEATVQAWMFATNLREVANGTSAAKDVFPKLTKVIGLLTSPAGIAALAVGALVAAVEYANRSQVVKKTADDFELLLIQANRAPGVFDDLNVAIGTNTHVFEDANGVLSKTTTYINEFGEATEAIEPVGRQSADSVQTLGDAIQAVVDANNQNAWTSFWGGSSSKTIFGLHTGRMKQAEEDTSALNDAIGEIARSGTSEELANALAYVNDEAERMGISAEDLAEVMPEVAQAEKVLEAQTERLAQETQAAAEEMVAFAGAMADMGALTPQVMHEINEGSKAFVSLSDAVSAATTEVVDGNGEMEFSFDSMIAALEKQVASQAEWADNMTALAGRVSDETIAELAKMGPEGALLVADLKNRSEEELAHFDELFLTSAQGAKGNMLSEFSTLNAEMAQKLSGINLNTLDPSGRLVQTFTELGYNVVDGTVVGMSGMESGMSGVLSNINWNNMEGGAQIIAMFEELGYQVTNGVITGFGEGDIAGAATDKIVTPIVNSVTSGLQIQSPSKVMAEYGADTVAGFVQGLDESTDTVSTAGTGIVDTLKSAFDGASQFLFGDGKASITGFVMGALGIDTTTPGEKKRDEMGSALKASDFRTQGTEKGNSFISAFSNVNFKTPGDTARNKVRDALGTGDFSTQGTAKGNSFTRAFEAIKYTTAGSGALGKLRDGLKNSSVVSAITTAGTVAGNAFKSSASAVNSYASGQTLGSRFASGISSMVGWVREAANKIAAAARNVLPRSPAKEGPFSGSGWGGWGEAIGEELAKGLLDKRKKVADAAGNLISEANYALASPEAQKAAQLAADGYAKAMQRSNRATALTTVTAERYATAQQMSRAEAYRMTVMPGQAGGSTVYNMTVTVDPKDLEGIKTVEEFVANAKLWSMM